MKNLDLHRRVEDLESRLESLFRQYKLTPVLARGVQNRTGSKHFQSKLGWRIDAKKEVKKEEEEEGRADEKEEEEEEEQEEVVVEEERGAKAGDVIKVEQGGVSVFARVLAQYDEGVFLARFDEGDYVELLQVGGESGKQWTKMERGTEEEERGATTPKKKLMKKSKPLHEPVFKDDSEDGEQSSSEEEDEGWSSKGRKAKRHKVQRVKSSKRVKAGE